MLGCCVKCGCSRAGKSYYGYCADCWVRLTEERRRILIEHNPIIVHRTTPGWPTWFLLAYGFLNCATVWVVQWLIHWHW